MKINVYVCVWVRPLYSNKWPQLIILLLQALFFSLLSINLNMRNIHRFKDLKLHNCIEDANEIAVSILFICHFQKLWTEWTCYRNCRCWCCVLRNETSFFLIKEENFVRSHALECGRNGVNCCMKNFLDAKRLNASYLHFVVLMLWINYTSWTIYHWSCLQMSVSILM